MYNNIVIWIVLEIYKKFPGVNYIDIWKNFCLHVRTK